MRKEQFKRPEPGFSMYEGRTRGKRVKYTYSDDEDVFYSDSTNRRSTRNTGANTPAESGPVTTASGRQIRAPPRMTAGDDSAAVSVQGDFSEDEQEGSRGATSRTRRSATAGSANGWSETNGRGRSRRSSMDSDDGVSEADFGDDEEDADAQVAAEFGQADDLDDEAMGDDDMDKRRQSLVIKLAVKAPKLRTALSPIDPAPNALHAPDAEDQKPFTIEMPTTTATDAAMIDSPAPQAEDKEQPVSPTENKLAKQSPCKPDTKPEETGSDATPASPVALSSAPLAFRGSPEKKHVQPVAMPDILNAPQ